MGWTLTGLGVALVIVVVAGAALALCRRYRIGWQWGPRNVWNVCEEWRQRLSWLWAPREEKVSLVKAQCPTAQTNPGLYRQTGNTSQHLFHSDSDLRLDAQGAFTRFESVDRDLHPPLSTAGSTIPPQPLRPAPQPRPTARPRLSPLQTSSAIEYLRMQESGPGPLTPPPPMQRPSAPSRPPGPSVFLFQTPSNPSYKASETSFRYEEVGPTSESIHMESRLRYELEEERRQQDNRCSPYRQFDNSMESSGVRYRMLGGSLSNLDGKVEDDSNDSYGSYDIIQRNHMATISQSVMEPVYEPGALPKMLQSTRNLGNDLDRKNNEMQSIEMKPFRSYSLQDDIDSSYLFQESQGLQKVSQYIRSLPVLPVYDTMNELDQDHGFFDDEIPEPINMMNFNSDSTPSPVPPPPAPPDPLQDVPKKNGKITGEMIFNALKLFTLQNSSDQSKFYNAIRSPQQPEQYSSPSRYPSLIEDSINSQLQSDMQDIYAENDSDVLSVDGFKRSSDLYSPELNMEAQRTAQEVSNSLQNPPSSPLLLKDQEIYAYETDPSFTRTSEDILNSIKQRRKSMESQNGIFNELNELEDSSAFRMRSTQEFGSVLDDMPIKQRSSQAFMTNYSMNDYNGISPGNRRGSQGPEPEPPPDETDLKRALSCESMCSDTSVVITDLEEAPDAGLVCIGVQYDIGRGADNGFNLCVSILEARYLITPDGQPAQNTYVRVFLLSDTIYTDRNIKTRLYKGSSSPSYQENFVIVLNGSPIGSTLLIKVYSSMDGNDTLIGVATFQLGPLLRTPATTWLNLIGSQQPTPRLGELMFSLSYLPTAERLTLVVVKAKNLRGVSSVPGDFFVKVYLLQQGKKIHKKRTSIKKGENNPIFNESIIFQVPSHTLANIQLRLTVAEINGDQNISTKPYSVGHIIVGPTSTGKALEHWSQMMMKVRRPISMWHPLRK